MCKQIEHNGDFCASLLHECLVSALSLFCVRVMFGEMGRSETYLPMLAS